MEEIIEKTTQEAPEETSKDSSGIGALISIGIILLLVSIAGVYFLLIK